MHAVSSHQYTSKLESSVCSTEHERIQWKQHHGQENDMAGVFLASNCECGGQGCYLPHNRKIKVSLECDRATVSAGEDEVWQTWTTAGNMLRVPVLLPRPNCRPDPPCLTNLDLVSQPKSLFIKLALPADRCQCLLGFVGCGLHYIYNFTFLHFAAAFIQRELVHSTEREQTQQQGLKKEGNFFQKATLQSAGSKCHRKCW